MQEVMLALLTLKARVLVHSTEPAIHPHHINFTWPQHRLENADNVGVDAAMPAGDVLDSHSHLAARTIAAAFASLTLPTDVLQSHTKPLAAAFSHFDFTRNL